MRRNRDKEITHIIVGGGHTGLSLAKKLILRPENIVLLIEKLENTAAIEEYLNTHDCINIGTSWIAIEQLSMNREYSGSSHVRYGDLVIMISTTVDSTFVIDGQNRGIRIVNGHKVDRVKAKNVMLCAGAEGIASIIKRTKLNSVCMCGVGWSKDAII